MVHADADPEEPDLPIALTEARVRDLGDGEEWCWDRFDLTDAGSPSYQIIRAKDGSDVTEQVRGAADWPARFVVDGEPVMPYATYHATRTNQLFDHLEAVETVEGTLTIAVLWSWWLHGVRDSAWAQRWTMDAHLRGASSVGSGAAAASTVSTDPSSVMQFASDGDRGSLGQWNPPVDPLTLGTAISEYESRLLVQFGLSSADVQQHDSSTQSGVSISLRRDAVREAQRRFRPQFERGDKQVLRIMSGLTDGRGPADGWSISYPGAPEGVEEMQARIDRFTAMIEAGLASRVDAYMDIHPGVSREQATDDLRRIAAENRELA